MKIKVGVMFGGKSVEHEISIISAIQAIGSMDTEKYDVIPIYITKNNEFYVGPSVGEIENYRNIPQLLKDSTRVILVNDGGLVKLIRYPAKRFGSSYVDYLDVAFPIVHGTNVEDGTLQGFLTMLDIPYVGCDVVSSAVGMDKYVMKTVLKDNNIPVLDCLCFNAKEYDRGNDEVVDAIEKRIGFPVIVKPVNLGSSIGISKADNREKLYESLDMAFCYADKVLVERAVQNLKEINCSVCGDYEHAEPSECEEPVNSDEILSFADKYLGNGSSVSASIDGKCVDTSMGLTPLEGLPMGTRSGNLDPAILQFIMNKYGYTADEMLNILNKKSGVLGISGVGSDFRDLEKAAKEGNERAQLALDKFAYEVRKYIGSYAAAMGGVDIITFTAGVGENGPDMRESICEGLGFLGVHVDHEKNQVRGKETDISAADSTVKVYVIPTNEELMIAQDTAALVNAAK